jgi:hypothetical protein
MFENGPEVGFMQKREVGFMLFMCEIANPCLHKAYFRSAMAANWRDDHHG